MDDHVSFLMMFLSILILQVSLVIMYLTGVHVFSLLVHHHFLVLDDLKPELVVEPEEGN